MPAVSQAQQRLFGMAVAYKRGELPDASAEVRRLAESLSLAELERFARTVRHSLPEHAENLGKALGLALFESAMLGGGQTAPALPALEKALTRAIPPGPPKRAAFKLPKDGEWDHDVRHLHPDEHELHIRHHEAEFRGLLHGLHQVDPKAEQSAEARQELVRRMRKCSTHWRDHRVHQQIAREAAQNGVDGAQAARKRPAGTKPAREPHGPKGASDKPLRKAMEPRELTRLMALTVQAQTGSLSGRERSELAGLEYVYAWEMVADAFQSELDPEDQLLLDDGSPAASPVQLYLAERQHWERLTTGAAYMDPESRETGGGTLDFRGLPILIETDAGEVRSGKGWTCTLRYPYGEILGTLGVDGDPLDVVIGPNEQAPNVYVVHLHALGEVREWPGGSCPVCGEPPEGCLHALDEDKCFLGFQNEEDVRAVFRTCYDSEVFLGPISVFPFAEFYALVEQGRRPIRREREPGS